MKKSKLGTFVTSDLTPVYPPQKAVKNNKPDKKKPAAGKDSKK